MTTDESPLIVRIQDSCAILIMNRPEAMNALSGALRRRLIAALADLDHDDAVRVVILTGAGKAFTAGLDLKELAGSGTDVSANVDAENVVAAIERFSKPLIAAVNGVAVTGGVEIILACDIILASEAASFADTHVRVGLTPGWGLSQRLSRLIGVHRAKELSFTARRFSAREAEAWGLVNHVHPAGDLMPEALALARSIAQWSPDAVRAMKAIIDRGLAMPLGQALAMEAATASRENARVAMSASVLPGRTA
ncbi:enoyl-CoA hydratase [Azospirillum agricola]|uniref:enoyl-CoA hydratase n=1 Tax=Azospirillum agricola TaxID=1720247 RepID=UPI000A0F1A68|nr:enoyl-CoA hydratase [Azospirillum agricola]SMH38959.1 short chain enoyl-CoA hydratase [Azospirillum lipoferum]